MKSVFLLERIDYDEYSLEGCYNTLAAAKRAKFRRDGRNVRLYTGNSHYFPITYERKSWNFWSRIREQDYKMLPKWLTYDFSDESRLSIREVKVLGTTSNRLSHI